MSKDRYVTYKDARELLGMAMKSSPCALFSWKFQTVKDSKKYHGTKLCANFVLESWLEAKAGCEIPDEICRTREEILTELARHDGDKWREKAQRKLDHARGRKRFNERKKEGIRPEKCSFFLYPHESFYNPLDEISDAFKKHGNVFEKEFKPSFSCDRDGNWEYFGAERESRLLRGLPVKGGANDARRY